MKLKNLFKAPQKFLYLDIDRHYFTKPTSHFIYYRKSASGRHYHLKFNPEWLNEHELYSLFIQCDHKWLCHSIVRKSFRVAATKKGKRSGPWKKTHMPIPLLVVRSCGAITLKIQIGYALFDRTHTPETSWIQKSRDEMSKLFKKLPWEFKTLADLRAIYIYEHDDDYDDWEDDDVYFDTDEW